MMDSVIRTQGLSRNFGHTLAVDHIDLAVPEGAIYALVGPNGAGKTTTIKLLMNILRPSAGSAQVLGTDIRSLTGKAFTRIGYISENQELPDGMTVESMLDYFRAFYPTWDRTFEQQLIRQFDLPLKRKLKHLSRGMKMKASFASSLAYRPSLIVLDEPFSGLDPLVRDELIDCLLELAQEATVFISSHDLAEIETFASHVGFLEQGRLLFSEEISALTGRFREVTVTLDTPVQMPDRLPSTWLHPQSTERALRYVDSNYVEQTSQRELSTIIPSARGISVDAMSLRSIFLAIAKSHRGAGAYQPNAQENRA